MHHTNNNISLSFAKLIDVIVTNKNISRLKKLKEDPLDRQHAGDIDYSSTNTFQSKFQTENYNNITFIRSRNSNQNFKTITKNITKNNNKADIKSTETVSK